jgi:peptide/nickel transport system permease protein
MRLRELTKHPLAFTGFILLSLLYLCALFAPFIAPYGLNEYDRQAFNRYQAPTQLHWRDPTTGEGTWPFVCAKKREVDNETFQAVFVDDCSQRSPLQFFVRRPEAPYHLFGFIPTDVHLFGVAKPQYFFLLGTDSFGRDVFSRLLYGAQISLTIGLVAVILVFVLGVSLGGIAGYFGGWIGMAIMRFTELLSAFPTLFLLIILASLLPPGLHPLIVYYGIVFMLGLVSWGSLAQVVRAEVLSHREREYVQASKSLGAGHFRLLFRHILPNTISYLIISATLAIPGFILAESGLSFIGKGIREPYASWGLLLNDIIVGGLASLSSHPWVLAPGFLIALTIMAWSWLGDGLRDIYDPRG